MNSQAFADVIDATATLPSGGCSQLLRAIGSPLGVTHFVATITTSFRPPRDISHCQSSLFRVLRAPSDPTVATHPVYKLQ
jgi:hypothetical protein